MPGLHICVWARLVALCFVTADRCCSNRGTLLSTQRNASIWIAFYLCVCISDEAMQLTNENPSATFLPRMRRCCSSWFEKPRTPALPTFASFRAYPRTPSRTSPIWLSVIFLGRRRRRRYGGCFNEQDQQAGVTFYDLKLSISKL